MIEIFRDRMSKSGLSLHDAILRNVKNGLRNGTSEFLFQENKEQKLCDLMKINVISHFYNPKKYIGPPPPPKQAESDPLSPPYNEKVNVIHLMGGPAHYIIPNKDLVKFGHIVISSDNPRDMQGEPLDDRDFACLADIFSEFDEHGIAYYNSGIESGCSQLHKHFQYIPYDEHPIVDAILQGRKIPFQIYKRQMEWFNFDSIKKAYTELLDEAKNGRYGKQMKAYNFVLTKKLALFVPRSRARSSFQIIINSLGICGHLFLWETSDSRILQYPMSTISEVCYPPIQ
ncbi:hypothetical protein TVAG_189060 [Trichomonas vaginalis G3]|uniref:Uncharacterized protein n=1 Tax=Trichomonas vaginalis (strain ATCC PRA-98 / G3) TaxID=412133 RepID=A2F326_TRIV3|nr:ATP adenylyltransferase family [Trichomonas vaginalis G3]EAY00690.1 hypothetical protein TVAG_189060 [Trichomonas vaginalis G3]KAI5513282.1 ATP adenylyltransferase family [Trichomonas vaginalis G3]|eukprot:XP_001313619.1 hypothetical protein [Trichomonas vaginalis G3]